VTLETIRPHWRTILGAAVGATGGALYAHYVGCNTGSCGITGNPWVAGLFFGFSGAVVSMPGPKKEEPREDEGKG